VLSHSRPLSNIRDEPSDVGASQHPKLSITLSTRRNGHFARHWPLSMASNARGRASTALLKLHGPNTVHLSKAGAPARRVRHISFGPASTSLALRRRRDDYFHGALCDKCSAKYAQRSFATSSKPAPPQKIAVLGGGLTGLTTAFYLTRFLPHAKITLYESSNRLGGWAETRGEVEEDPYAPIFELGPRAINVARRSAKYDDMVFLDVVCAFSFVLDRNKY
jgi:hypothetical protein